jgi:hypothetical protein
MNEAEPLLERWANFYLLMAAAAATLIGLLFVVITLAAERMPLKDTPKIRVYLTPTVVYFASVLAVAALLTFPNHTRLTATLCICLAGVVGSLYSVTSLIGADKKLFEELHDRMAYAIVPFAAYGLFVLGGVRLLYTPNADLPWWLSVC